MHIVIFVTASSKREARKIAQALIKQKAAACVNIIDKIESLFRWQGRLDSAKEALLIVKSTKDRLNRIITIVKANHSYQVPEIIAMPIIAGDKPYLRWIDESLRQPV